VLEIFRAVCRGKTEPYAVLCELFDEETSDGRDMEHYNVLLDSAIRAIACQSDKKTSATCLSDGGGKLLDDTQLPKTASDFDLVTWLVIMEGKEDADV